MHLYELDDVAFFSGHMWDIHDSYRVRTLQPYQRTRPQTLQRLTRLQDG